MKASRRQIKRTRTRKLRAQMLMLRRRLARQRLVPTAAAYCVVLALTLILLVGTAQVRVALKSAGFLIEIFPNSPAYPQRWFIEEPSMSLITFPHGEERQSAYLYEPDGDGCFSGLILYIGMGPEHRDSHLDRAARAFARNGITVLIPVSPAMVNYEIAPYEHEYAASAFQELRGRPDVHPDRVGMFGVSVGGSVVANAAQEQDVSASVAMVHSLGGYYDAFDLLAAMALGGYEVDGEWIEWEPSDTTVRVIRDSILTTIPREDYVELWHLFTDRSETIPGDLTPDGHALAEFMTNRDPERVPDLIEALPSQLSEYMKSISPAYGIERLQANTLLLHDVNDHVVPYGESLRFYDELPETTTGHLTLLHVFHHVRPDEEGDRRSLISDGARLYRHIYRMNRYLDGRDTFDPLVEMVPFIQRESGCD